MTQLTCELCNSTNFEKKHSSFVCQNCGMKYSVEEAKKIINGTASSQSTNDNSKEIKVKVENAIREFNANNLTLSYSMLAEVLNIDPENTDAIIYKALALGWQASISEPKIAIVMNEYIRAFKIIKNTSSGTYEFTRKIITPVKLFGEMGDASFQAYSNYLENEGARANNHIQSEGKRAQLAVSWSYAEAKQILSTAERHSKEILSNAGKIFKDGNDNVARCMGGIAVEIFTLIDKDYEHVCEEFIQQIKHYLALIQRRCKDGDVSKNTIEFANKIENVVNQADEAFEAAWEKALVEKNKKYWENNSETYAELINKKEELEKKLSEKYSLLNEKECELSELEKEYHSNKTPHEIESDNLDAEIQSLIKDKEKLGLFKFKEKKALAAQIEEKEKVLDAIWQKAEKEKEEKEAIFNKEKETIQQECNDIEKIIENLTKRQEKIDATLDNGLSKQKEERTNKRKEDAINYWMTMGLSKENAENYVNLVLFSPFKD